MAKDEGHGFAKKSNRDFQIYASLLFLKRVPARLRRSRLRGPEELSRNFC